MEKTPKSTIMKKPEPLSMQTIYEASEEQFKQEHGVFYKPGKMAIILGMPFFLRPFIRPNGVYLIDDYRIGMVCQGETHVRVNLIEHRFSTGDVMIVAPGSVIEPLDFSDDVLLAGLGLTTEEFQTIFPHSRPEMFNGGITKWQIRVDQETQQMFIGMLRTLLQLCQTKECSEKTQHSMMAAYINLVNDHYLHTTPQRQGRRPAGADLFDRFMTLVNTHAKAQHKLNFYADHLYVTPHHLGNVVTQVSGLTAKEWIDRAIITSAKVMLRHTNMQVAEISDQLHFANPSFFCKYFRRMEGMSPQEYRES